MNPATVEITAAGTFYVKVYPDPSQAAEAALATALENGDLDEADVRKALAENRVFEQGDWSIRIVEAEIVEGPETIEFTRALRRIDVAECLVLKTGEMVRPEVHWESDRECGFVIPAAVDGSRDEIVVTNGDTARVEVHRPYLKFVRKRSETGQPSELSVLPLFSMGSILPK